MTTNGNGVGAPVVDESRAPSPAMAKLTAEIDLVEEERRIRTLGRPRSL